MRRSMMLGVVCLATVFGGPLTSQALGCPMCKAAVEEKDRRPQAYMYSILFMLAVPATIFSGLGFGLYKINQADHASLDEQAEDE